MNEALIGFGYIEQQQCNTRVHEQSGTRRGSGIELGLARSAQRDGGVREQFDRLDEGSSLLHSTL